MVFQFTPWHLTLGGIERSNQGHWVFIGLCIICKCIILDSGAVRPRGLLFSFLITYPVSVYHNNVSFCIFCILYLWNHHSPFHQSFCFVVFQQNQNSVAHLPNSDFLNFDTMINLDEIIFRWMLLKFFVQVLYSFSGYLMLPNTSDGCWIWYIDEIFN